MLRLFSGYEEAVRRTCEIAQRCRFSLDQLTYTYPTERLEAGLTAQERLEKLTWEGAGRRYPDGLPDNVATQLRHELNLIERMFKPWSGSPQTEAMDDVEPCHA